MYYIKALKGDKVYLSNNKEDLVIQEDELDTFKGVVVGYNRLTKAVKVSSLEELSRYYKSRSKLSGNEEQGNTVASLFKLEPIITKEEIKGITATLSVEDLDGYEYFSRLEIDYGELFRRAYEEYNDYLGVNGIFGDTFGNLHINYDLRANGAELICIPVKELCGEMELTVTGVKFSETTDLTGFSRIENLCNFVELPDSNNVTDYSIPLYTVYSVSSNMVIDMGNVKVSRKSDIKSIFGGYTPKSIVPPIFVDNGDVSELMQYPMLISSDYMYKSLHDFRRLSKNNAPVKIISDIRLNYKYVNDLGMNMHRCRVRGLNLNVPYEKLNSNLIDSIELTDPTVVITDSLLEPIKQLSEDKVDILSESINFTFKGNLSNYYYVNNEETRVLENKIETLLSEYELLKIYELLCKITIVENTSLYLDIFFEDGLKGFTKEQCILACLLVIYSFDRQNRKSMSKSYTVPFSGFADKLIGDYIVSRLKFLGE